MPGRIDVMRIRPAALFGWKGNRRHSAEIIAEAPGWYKYDLPQHLIGKSWKGKYRGQTQKWFAARFLGADSEINLAPPGHKQEFDQWRWASMDEIVGLIVPFKKPVYEQVIAAFRYLGQL